MTTSYFSGLTLVTFVMAEPNLGSSWISLRVMHHDDTRVFLPRLSRARFAQESSFGEPQDIPDTRTGCRVSRLSQINGSRSGY
jgi:hypothetical protein